jgi:hypothetical protein
MSNTSRGTEGGPDQRSTGRLLVGLAVFAVFMTVLGIAVIWSLTYGPFG